jgi:hypothetical protein
MPRTTLGQQVESAKPNAIDRAILATAIMRETWYPIKPEDTRAPDVKEFEKKLWRHVPQSEVFIAMAEKVYGAKINAQAPSITLFRPPFLSVFVPVKSWKHEDTKDDNWNGLKYGTAYIAVSPQRRDIFRDAAGNKVIADNLYTAHLRPATDQEVEQVVNGLFSVRPALTVKLFDAADDAD